MHGVLNNGTPWCCCPDCGKYAFGVDEIYKQFGLRTPNNYLVPQSNCRECRQINLNLENLKDIMENKKVIHTLLQSEKLCTRCNDINSFEYMYNNSYTGMRYSYESDSVVKRNPPTKNIFLNRK